jgi:hypothetical protein
MTFEEAMGRLVELARQSGGTVRASQVEADPDLSTDHDTVSAAAHKLAGSTNVFASQEDDERAWFPYSELVFAETR